LRWPGEPLRSGPEAMFTYMSLACFTLNWFAMQWLVNGPLRCT